MEEACKSLKLVRFFIFSPLSFSSRRFFFVGIILSHRFHRYTQIFFIMIFLHRISRRNRRHSGLSDYSRIFAEFWPLANGSRPIYAPVVFCHADFADDADFSSWEGFVPQISQIYTDFLWNLWWISLSNLRGYLQRPDRSHLRKSVSNRHSRKSPNKFRGIRWKKSHEKKSASSAKSAWLKKRPNKYLCISVKSVGQKTPMKKSVYICEICGTFSSLRGICNDRTGRICENPWVIVSAVNLRINSVKSDE